MCKVLENKALSDEARMESLENQLKDARILAEEADKKYDDIAKKLQMVESDLDRAEERADTGESYIIDTRGAAENFSWWVRNLFERWKILNFTVH